MTPQEALQELRQLALPGFFWTLAVTIVESELRQLALPGFFWTLTVTIVESELRQLALPGFFWTLAVTIVESELRQLAPLTPAVQIGARSRAARTALTSLQMEGSGG